MKILLIHLVLAGLVFTTALAQDGTDMPMVLKPKGHKGLIRDLDLSPDGKQIVTAGQDKTIRVWDVDTYEQRGEFMGHIGSEKFGAVLTTQVSPDGRYLAASGVFGNRDHRQSVADIRLYDYHTQKIVHVFTGHQMASNTLQWSSDSRYLISACNDHSIGIWDVQQLAPKAMLKGHGDVVWAADIYKDKIVSASEDNLVMLWDMQSGQTLATSYDHVGAVVRVAFHPSGQYILSGANDNQINIYDSDLNFLDALYLDRPVSAMAFDTEGQLALFGFGDGSIRVYRFSEGTLAEQAYYKPHQGAYVAGLAITPDQRIFSAGGADSNIAVYQLTAQGADSLTNLSGSTQKVWGAGLNGELLAFSTGTKPWGHITGLRDVDFSHGFQMVSREYQAMDENKNNVFKATLGGSFTERTAYFKGKKYDYKVPVTTLGGLHAYKNGATVTVEYTPDPSLTNQLNTKGKYQNFQFGEVPVTLSGGGEKYTIAFTPDSLLMVGGTGGYLRAFNLDGQEVTRFDGHEDVVFTVNMSTDDRWVISGSHDQSIRLWDARHVGSQAVLRPTATCFFSQDGEWIVALEEGYYMSSTAGGKYIGFHQNQGYRKEAKFYPFENFDLKYNRPDLVLAKLEMGTPALHDLLYKAYQKRLKKMKINEQSLSGEVNMPEVVINTASQTVDSKMYQLALSATDSEGLDRIHVYVNDIPIFGSLGISVKDEKDNKKVEKKIPVELSAGKNKIQVAVMNSGGIESLKETVHVYYDGPEVKPDLHVVAIGVSNYLDSNYNLTYASKDATDVTNLFFSHHERYAKIHIHKFTDALAKRELILAVKDKLMQTKIEDEVIIFAAGHGLLDSQLDYYFATQDIDFNNPAGRGLKYESLEGLLDGIPARNKLMLIDACHSGEVDKDDVRLVDSGAAGLKSGSVSARGFTKKPQPVGMDNIFELMQTLFADLRRGTGAMVISSSSGVEFSLESDTWKNGVFTYAILEGLKSGKADKSQDGAIQTSELKDYVAKRVSELTNGQQHPTSRRENLEFDFVVW